MRRISPIPAEPGQRERYDCEYRRNGTVNLFIFLDAHRPWPEVKVTKQRTARDFTQCMRDLAHIHYPQAEQIRVVLDNLSTNSPGALHEAFPTLEARRLLRRLEFHYPQACQLAQHGRDRDPRRGRSLARLPMPRRLRGQSKAHKVPAHGRIARLFKEAGYGFIEGADSEEVYMHRNSVVHDGFD